MSAKLAALCLLAAGALSACGGGGDPAPPAVVTATAARQTQACTLSHLFVTVRALRLQGEGRGRRAQIELASPRRIDLLQPTGVLQALEVAPLGPGSANDVRLVLARDLGDTTAQEVGGPVLPLKVDGDALRLRLQGEVPAGRMADLVVSPTDACSALHGEGRSGEFELDGDIPARPRLLPFTTDRESPLPGSLLSLPDRGFLNVQTAGGGVFALQRFNSYGDAVTASTPLTVSDVSGFAGVVPLANAYLGFWLGVSPDPILRFADDFPLMAQPSAVDGTPLAPPVQVALTQPFTTRIFPPSLPRATMLTDGGAALVWVQLEASSLNVYLQRFASDGTLAGAPQRVNTDGPGGLPNVTALTGARVLVTWGIGSLFARVFQSDGSAGPQQAIAPGAASFSGPAVAAPLAGGGAAVAWSAQLFGSSSFVQFVALAPDGAPLAAPAVADGSTFVNQGIQPQTQPSIGGLADGSFVVAWAAQGNVQARRFTADGAAMGGVTQVNVFTKTAFTSVIPLAWGGFLIGWPGGAGGPSGDFVRLFDAQGLTGG